MRIAWRAEWPNWLLIAGMWLAAAVTWSSAPDRFPVHWGITGQVDRYGGKVEGVLMMPALALGIYLLLLFLPRIDPGRANYEKFAGAYSVIRLAVMAMLAGIYLVSQLAARGYPVEMNLLVPMGVGALLVVMGNYMGKIRPNWFVGIRTPWTISSKRSWTRTHRLGGWVMIGMGLTLILAGVLRTPWVFMAAAAVLLAGVVWMFVYSYLVWRSDPERQPPAGTLPR